MHVVTISNIETIWRRVEQDNWDGLARGKGKEKTGNYDSKNKIKNSHGFIDFFSLLTLLIVTDIKTIFALPLTFGSIFSQVGISNIVYASNAI